MLRQIKTLVPLVLILCWTFQLAVPSKALAQQPTAPQSQGELVAPDPEFEKPGEPPTAAPPAAQPAAQPPAGTATGPANQPGSTVQVPPAQRGQELSKEGGAFVIKRNVQEVTLHATVVDERQRIVTGLDQNAFQIFENGEPQKLTSFRREEVPVALGIVIDNSGTMRDKRPAVNQAALNLIKASNPEDQVFVVNFNQEPYLDQDYTGNVDLLREALERIESRGGTALYDAVVAAADHLMKTAKLEKKAILVVTDGDDNASRQSLEQAIRRIAVDGGPTVYSIGILGGEKQKRARRALRTLAEQTGGVSFFPNDLSEVDNISRQVAHDIRNQYVLQYAPTVAKAEGGYRTVKVEARAPGYKRLQVRTRTGYYANEQQRAAK